MDRRRFLASSSLALASAVFSRLSAFPPSQPIGLQMYTLRDLAEKDLPSVLTELQKIGYCELELYWNLYSRPAKELRTMINDHGLTAPSGHLNYEGLDSKLEYARELGLEYAICPMLPESMWNALDDFKCAADQFNKWGEKAKAMGMRFGFHNHNYEFRRFARARRLSEKQPQPPSQSMTGFDVIAANTDPKLVCLE